MKRRIVLVSSCAVLALTVGACSGTSSDVSNEARTALAPVTTSTTTPSPTSTTTAPCNLFDTAAPTPRPTPGDFPARSALRKIYDRGYLIAGIDENTPHLGERDPRNAEFHGLEVDLVYEIAAAIFGDPDPGRVRFKTVVTKEKNDVVEHGVVDLTASADSVTCERKQKVDFSSVYLETGHVLLVRGADGIAATEQLAGRPVCVTAGSSSVGLLAEKIPTARPVEVDARNDCLVALQQGDADAYLGHTTFARGMRDQDPSMVILPESLRTQDYGIAVSKDAPDLLGLVNGVLQEMRDDGGLATLFSKNGVPMTEFPLIPVGAP